MQLLKVMNRYFEQVRGRFKPGTREWAVSRPAPTKDDYLGPKFQAPRAMSFLTVLALSGYIINAGINALDATTSPKAVAGVGVATITGYTFLDDLLVLGALALMF